MASITLITGCAGSGKSTVCRALAGRFDQCLHLRVDDLREMMASGLFTAAHGWSDEGRRQFQLARTTAIQMARLYAGQGITVLIDDVCVPPEFADHYAPLFADPSVRRFLLLPGRAAVRERIRQRGNPWDHLLIDRVDEIYDFLEPMPKTGWTVLDTSAWTIDETVSEIASRLSNARP